MSLTLPSLAQLEVALPQVVTLSSVSSINHSESELEHSNTAHVGSVCRWAHIYFFKYIGPSAVSTRKLILPAT